MSCTGFSVWGFGGEVADLGPAGSGRTRHTWLVSQQSRPGLSWSSGHVCPDNLHPIGVETVYGQGNASPLPEAMKGLGEGEILTSMPPKDPWVYFNLNNIETHEEENSNFFNFPPLTINKYIIILVYSLANFLKRKIFLFVL